MQKSSGSKQCVYNIAIRKDEWDVHCALTLLDGWQKGIRTVKTEWWDAGMVICLSEVQISIWPS